MQNYHANSNQFTCNPYNEGLSQILNEMFGHSHCSSDSITVIYNSDKTVAEAMFKCECDQVIKLIAWKSYGSMYIATQAEYDPKFPFRKGLKGMGRDAKCALKDLCEQIELEYCNQNHD